MTLMENDHYTEGFTSSGLIFNALFFLVLFLVIEYISLANVLFSLGLKN